MSIMGRNFWKVSIMGNLVPNVDLAYFLIVRIFDNSLQDYIELSVILRTT